MEVTVCIGTFGDKSWIELAKRAIASVPNNVPVIHRHEESLSAARNACLDSVATEWVIYLDADDELEPGYTDAMASGTADMRAPAVRYVRGNESRAPYVPKVAGHNHDCTGDCLPDGNWLVIGSAVRAVHAKAIGGFREYEVYEDWDFFQRLWLDGATVEAIPEAIYRAHVRFDSRNRAPSMQAKNRVHHEIVAANFGEKAA